MGKPRKKVVTGQNSRGGGGGRGRGHKSQGGQEKEELWEQMERAELQSDEADSEQEEGEEEEVRAPFPVGMWDLLHCDPKGELMINHPDPNFSKS